MYKRFIGTLEGLRAECAPSVDTWIFRGQAYDLTPALSTTLERSCLLADGGLARAIERERWVLREFQRRLHHYIPQVPQSERVLEWLALMQHHGAPTRLLDWTYSPYIGAFFACEHALKTRGDAAVWMLNREWATASSAETLEGWTRPFVSNAEGVDDSDEWFEQAFITREPARPCLFPIDSFRQNERQTIQKGLFTAVGDPTKGCVENLQALEGYGDPVNAKVIVVPRADIPMMVRELAIMNITSATLFPGLDGFARSLSFGDVPP